MPQCPFCNHDPYHYVDNGIGMEAVAITCCEPGIALFSRNKPETVTISYDEFSEIADKLYALRYEQEVSEKLRDAVQKFLDGRMKGFTDSRFVDDDLVELAAAISDLKELETGVVPERETWWLVERKVSPPQYVIQKDTSLPSLTDDPWRAARFATEREACDYRLRLSSLRDECKETEHVFINKLQPV